MRNRLIRSIIASFIVILLGGTAFSSKNTARLKSNVQKDNTQITRIVEINEGLLKKEKYDIVRANINSIEDLLRSIGSATKEIRKEEPKYMPNPPLNFSNLPVKAALDRYYSVFKLGQDLVIELNSQYQEANQNLLKAKDRQIATIAIASLKMTIENAPGRQGGKVIDIAVEGLKKFNGIILDEKISKPISGISEGELLLKNRVEIENTAKIMKLHLKRQEEVKENLKKIKARIDKFTPLAAFEEKLKKYNWLKEAGVETVDRFDGNYSGTFFGQAEGTFSFSIAKGKINGKFRGKWSDGVLGGDFTGSIDEDGNMNCQTTWGKIVFMGIGGKGTTKWRYSFSGKITGKIRGTYGTGSWAAYSKQASPKGSWKASKK